MRKKLDAYIFGQVCRLQKRILDESKKLLSVSVNLSRSSILCEEIVEQYTKIVRENDIPITCVPLEITESASVYGQKVVKVTERLLQSGFKLHIDDFESGYSSMESLGAISPEMGTNAFSKSSPVTPNCASSLAKGIRSRYGWSRKRRLVTAPSTRLCLLLFNIIVSTLGNKVDFTFSSLCFNKTIIY